MTLQTWDVKDVTNIFISPPQPENLLVEANNTGLGRLRVVDLGDAKSVQEGNSSPEARRINVHPESLDDSDNIYQNTRQSDLQPSSIEFCAPELLLREGEASVSLPGPPSDLWSAGALLYAFLSGVSPFLDDSPEETAAHIAATDFCFPPQFWAGVSERARALISKLLVGMPHGRATAQQCLNDAWLQQVGELHTDCESFLMGLKWSQNFPWEYIIYY